MKPIISNENTDTILTKDITERHLVVGKIGGRPCILSKGYSEEAEELTFFDLCSNFVTGNGIDYSSKENTIQKMVEKAISTGNKVAVFHQDNWKEALQWLIDNA